MSIKDLFDKGHSLKFVKNKTQDALAENVESSKYIEVYSSKRDRFIPDVDFMTASNFARFGLAEEYYDTAIKRIYQTYPYDGSQAEKIEWENESTYLDLFLFENEYPRTNGYIAFNLNSTTYVGSAASNSYSSSLPQYVAFNGGPNADPSGDYKSDFSAGPSKKGISKANIYHTASQRTNNLELDLDKGVTVEFWMKKDGPGHSSAHETIFDNVSLDASGNTTDYLSIKLLTSAGGVTSNIVTVSLYSHLGYSKAFSLDVGESITDGAWKHYAITLKNKDTTTETKLYLNGQVKDTDTHSAIYTAASGTMKAALGAQAAPNEDGIQGAGWGNVASASFDEFRYWKTTRSPQQIGRFYLDQIGGGTNTDNVKYNDISKKVDLGVYYKFNEGITGDLATDSIVLDYSGRISNGVFNNYNSSTSRNTGSAIVLSSTATKEFKDPIIYSYHPEVVSLAYSKQISGSAHDHENASSIYKTFPGWIAEEDEKESNNLKYLSQVISSYFDDLFLKIEKLPRLKDINYPDDTNYEKPLPFAERLLSSRGYDPPELFADVNDLAKYLERDEKILFEKKLYEVKNIIYQNIYNNLSFIQKSKGTFKSLRNFLRCFGVDEELIKLNIYSNNDTYELKDNVTHTAIRKKYIDFDDAETRHTANSLYSGSYTATAYQYYDSNDSNSLSYIPAATETLLTGAMMTIETEVIFPKRSIVGDPNYQLFPELTSSIFGLHAVAADNQDLTFDASDTINFNITAVKPDNDRRNVRFAINTSGSSVFTELENSSSFLNVYDNEKWNLAFRLRPTKSKTDTSLTSNTAVGYLEPAASAYTYELYGVNYLSHILQNEFILSGTISLAQAQTFFTKPKRIFLGAARTNFTGSVERYSDVKVSSTRVWLDYIPDEAIRAHARDANSYGALQPHRNSSDSINTYYVPQISTLVLNWTMDNITGSSPTGRFLIEDFASGSAEDKLRFGDSWAQPLSRHNYAGRGDNFIASSDQAVDVEFVQSGKLKLPEVVNSDDMVKILNKQDDLVFTRDTNYVQHMLSVEKSMYQTVSEEMLRIFATISDFNNLIGEPVNRYRPHYKKLEKLRELFFENVESEILDLDKFIEYFKWIDDAVSIMIAQLIPVSSNSTELLRNMVESHILERNKYWSKFPTLEVKAKEPVASLKAIEELKYNWKFGHAPVGAEQNTNQDENCLWWKQRAERSGVLQSGDTNVDSNKDNILKISITEVSGTEPTLQTIAGSRYAGTYYNNRSLARPIDLLTRRSLKLKGGSNPENNNIHDYYKGAIKWGSDDDFVYIDIGNKVAEPTCSDQEIPPELDKKKPIFKALTMTAHETVDSNASGSGANDQQYSDARSTLILPFSIHSSSVAPDGGYQSLYSAQFKLDFTNVHDDKYGPSAEIPLQGPFTEQHVGGLQHRHVALNRHDSVTNPGSTNKLDYPLTRAEGWFIQEFLNTSAEDTILSESFGSAVSIGITDTTILDPPIGSTAGDPSPYEYWRNGPGALEPWTFVEGPTPTPNTGPSSGKFAYCEVLPALAGEEQFSLVTPLIDILDVEGDVYFQFDYHMYGSGIGTLQTQASLDPNFQTGVEDIQMRWDYGGANIDSEKINGAQQTNSFRPFKLAVASTTSGLQSFKNKRFYIRFLYTSGGTQEGDCAIDNIRVYKGGSGVLQDSFKLLSPTHDNHNRPRAVYTRDTIAKRPVNIRNIHMTGNSPTIAGNYLNRYEYVSTTSPEANDPFFVKNNDQITRNTAEILGIGTGSIQEILTKADDIDAVRTRMGRIDYELPDRNWLVSGSVKNKTRFKARFSAPGGYENMSRGYLDTAHEIYSAYNETNLRNWWSRKVYNSHLQAHSGRFGVSTQGGLTNADGRLVFSMVGSSEAIPSNGQIFTLTNTLGITKTFKFDTSLSTTDGSLHSDGTSIAVGLGGVTSTEVTGQRVAATINSVANFNISASAEFNGSNASSVALTQLVKGVLGNTTITEAATFTTATDFTGGTDGESTARHYNGVINEVGSIVQAGQINSLDYTISGQPSVHKRHRNNVERIKHSGSHDFEGGAVVTSSFYDNAFVSHMIPRTDNQTRWITASLN